MKRNAAMFFSALVMALGIGYSGMADANKVLGFLDLVGNWDPDLIFVMVGAIGVHITTYGLITKKASPLFGENFQIPSRTDIDARLVWGTAIFGLGWSLSGYCPGPAIISTPTLDPKAIVFLVTMFIGMKIFRIVHSAYTAKAAETQVAK